MFKNNDKNLNRIKNELPNRTLHTCPLCNWSGEESSFVIKVLSIMYRQKYNSFQVFKQIKCPKCNNLISVNFETMEN